MKFYSNLLDLGGLAERKREISLIIGMAALGAALVLYIVTGVWGLAVCFGLLVVAPAG